MFMLARTGANNIFALVFYYECFSCPLEQASEVRHFAHDTHSSSLTFFQNYDIIAT